MTSRHRRAALLSVLTVAALAVGGCQPDAEPAPSGVEVTRGAAEGGAVTAEPTPEPEPTEQPEPEPSEPPSPDDAQCEATDAAMADLIGATDPLYDIFDVEKDPPYDWAGARGVHAELVQMAEAWRADTTDEILLADYPALVEALDELGATLEEEDDAAVSFASIEFDVLGVVLAAGTIVASCPNLGDPQDG